MVLVESTNYQWLQYLSGRDRLRPAETGAQVSFGFPTNGIFSTNATYANGAWSPSDPILTNGQAAFYFVPCITNCITLSCSADKTPCIPAAHDQLG